MQHEYEVLDCLFVVRYSRFREDENMCDTIVGNGEQWCCPEVDIGNDSLGS